MFKMTVLYIYKELSMNERICTSGQIERDQSFFGWL